MSTMKLFFEILIIFLASVNLLFTWPALRGLHQPTTLPLWGLKVFVSGLSPILFLAGLLFAILGFIITSIHAMLIGGLSAILFLIHILLIIQPPGTATGFEQVFGEHWEKQISPKRKVHFLSNRYAFLLPKMAEPVFNQNIPFYTIPGTDRQLLCDIWEPPQNIPHSGVAFIYLHGSAWAVLDKDFGTRPFFRRLANQGHVIMDVAYRLFPETDFMGMVHDAKHAIAWIKSNAVRYSINPQKIVIGGGSAGAHIALLAAYAEQDPTMMPADLSSFDLSVRAVISCYGQSDLAATYYHTCQHLTTHSALAQKKKGESARMPNWIRKSMGKNFHRLGFDKDAEPGMLKPMLGGNPDEKPEIYALYSPIQYVSNKCPATLILHGEQDILAPVNAIRMLYKSLKQLGVPVIMHIIPQTDHAFDLILPRISPSAHNAMYDVERFMSLMAISKKSEAATIVHH